MITPRRSILSVLALTPLAGAVSLAPAPALALPVDAGRSEADWLEHGTCNADAAFAGLCAEALRRLVRSCAADTLFDDALRAARAATPEFPPSLVFKCCTRDASGAIAKSWDQRWSPDERAGAVSYLWNLAHREAKARGVPYSVSIEADLRARYEAWIDAENAARARFMVSELSTDSDAAAIAAGDALTAVLDYQPPNADALLIKLHLLGLRYGVEDDNDASVELPVGRFSTLVADVARLLAS